MRCISLSSGSKGNCFYIENGRDALIIDAGISTKEIINRLVSVGGHPERVRAILTSHEHIDHVRGAITFSNKFNVPIYATEGTLNELITKSKTSILTNTIKCKPDRPITIEEFKIDILPTSHDSQEPCAFRISSNDINLVYCTDTGIITKNIFDWFNNCNILAIECNHDPIMLENGPYTDILKQRIRSTRGHLSNQDTLSCIKMISNHIDHAILIHISETNNTMEKIEKNVVAQVKNNVDITIAPYPDKTSPWIKL